MPARGSLLLVDLSNQAYKHTAVHGNLTAGDTFTGGLYGVLVSVCKIVREAGVTRIAVCEDVRPYVREYQHSAYKGDRDRDPELERKTHETKKLVRDLCRLLEIPIWAVPGFECDDIVAWAVEKHRHRFDRIIAMSNDSDLFALFEYGNFVLHRGKQGIYTQQDFREEFPGMSREQLFTYLAMVGTHNALTGIDGVGPVKAKKLLKDPAAMRKLRDAHGDLIDRNIELIRLPHSQFPKENDLRITKPRYNERAFLKFCSRYDITMTGSMRSALEQISDL